MESVTDCEIKESNSNCNNFNTVSVTLSLAAKVSMVASRHVCLRLSHILTQLQSRNASCWGMAMVCGVPYCQIIAFHTQASVSQALQAPANGIR